MVTELNRRASSADQTRQQHHHEDDQEDEKQYLCNACRGKGDSTKAQKAGDDCDYQKHQRPIENPTLRGRRARELRPLWPDTYFKKQANIRLGSRSAWL